MEAKVLCSSCGRNEAVLSCSECSTPLCENCAKEVYVEEAGPGYRHKGVVCDIMRPAAAKNRVCEICFKNVDFL